MTTSEASRLGPFPMPGYDVLVGPFTHLAAERDRLDGLKWEHFDARLLGATVGAELVGLDMTAELPDAVIPTSAGRCTSTR